MSHCYGYDSYSDLLEAGRKRREEEAEQREIDTLKDRIRKLEARIVALEAENSDLKNQLKAAMEKY